MSDVMQMAAVKKSMEAVQRMTVEVCARPAPSLLPPGAPL